MPNSPPPSLEDALAALECILRSLEDGTTTLEDALAQYEQGVGLLKQCYAQLQSAEARVRRLAASAEDPSAAPDLSPFEHSASVEKVAPPRARKRPPHGHAEDEIPF